MHNPTHNFLNWYKMCCDLDSSVYRKTIYNKNKAKIIFNIISNFDFAVYPLDGSENIFYGSKTNSESYIYENFNTKFLIFSRKNDSMVSYFIQNEQITII